MCVSESESAGEVGNWRNQYIQASYCRACGVWDQLRDPLVVCLAVGETAVEIKDPGQATGQTMVSKPSYCRNLQRVSLCCGV